MSAFDGEIKIARAVSDPQTDHTLPSSKSLSWKAITTPAALAGTTGAFCELVHGDKWNEIKGNHTENIAQNQTLKVVGKHKETLVESCYQNIIGPHIVQNNDVRNETRLNAYTKTYGDNTQYQNIADDAVRQSNHWEIIDYCEAHHTHDRGYIVDGFYTAVLVTSSTVVNVAPTLVNIELTAAEIQAILGHAEAMLGSAEVHLGHAEVHIGHIGLHNGKPDT
jgi:hypothetical protein